MTEPQREIRTLFIDENTYIFQMYWTKLRLAFWKADRYVVHVGSLHKSFEKLFHESISGYTCYISEYKVEPNFVCLITIQVGLEHCNIILSLISAIFWRARISFLLFFCIDAKRKHCDLKCLWIYLHFFLFPEISKVCLSLKMLLFS